MFSSISCGSIVAPMAFYGAGLIRFSIAPHGAIASGGESHFGKMKSPPGLYCTRQDRHWNIPIRFVNVIFRDSPSGWCHNTNGRRVAKIPCLEIKKNSLERHFKTVMSKA